MKNKEVCEAWNNGEEAKVKHLFSERSNGALILYSYGYHFPIALKFNDGIIINRNDYSRTTSRHKGELARVLGFVNFRELVERGKDNGILILTLEQIQRSLGAGLKSKAEIIEQNV